MVTMYLAQLESLFSHVQFDWSVQILLFAKSDDENATVEQKIWNAASKIRKKEECFRVPVENCM